MKDMSSRKLQKQMDFNREIFAAFDTIRAQEIYNLCNIIELTRDKVGILTSESINLSHYDRSKIKGCITRVYGDVSIVKITNKKPKTPNKHKNKKIEAKKEFFEPSKSSKKIPSLDHLPLWQSVKEKILKYYDEDRIKAWFESPHLEIAEKDDLLTLSPISSDFCVQYIYENYAHILERIAREENIRVRLAFHQGAVELPFIAIPRDKIEELISQQKILG